MAGPDPLSLFFSHPRLCVPSAHSTRPPAHIPPPRYLFSIARPRARACDPALEECPLPNKEGATPKDADQNPPHTSRTTRARFVISSPRPPSPCSLPPVPPSTTPFPHPRGLGRGRGNEKGAAAHTTPRGRSLLRRTGAAGARHPLASPPHPTPSGARKPKGKKRCKMGRGDAQGG